MAVCIVHIIGGSMMKECLLSLLLFNAHYYSYQLMLKTLATLEAQRMKVLQVHQ